MIPPAKYVKADYNMEDYKCCLTPIAALSMMPTEPKKAGTNVQSPTMLSIPHMIVVFLVVLVVFGPQKLPELARSFGKLMAEFRKASNDFKGAFEEEMRDLERQARVAELKKQVAEANAAASAATAKSAETAGNGAPGTTTTNVTTPPADGPVISPVAESVPRLDATNGETAAVAQPPEALPSGSTTENPPSHDQQQPA
jgi:sec-independent protein translocase protein TatB